jgi:hypothetical protein
MDSSTTSEVMVALVEKPNVDVNRYHPA